MFVLCWCARRLRRSEYEYCERSQAAGLREFYRAVNNASVDVWASWDTVASEDNWNAVCVSGAGPGKLGGTTCDSSGRVVRLELPDKGLVANVTDMWGALGAVSSLTVLDLESNPGITSELDLTPDGLGVLSGLKTLHVGHCGITSVVGGSIDGGTFVSMPKIEDLSLAGVPLGAVDDDALAPLTNLRHADLTGCAVMAVLPNLWPHFVAMPQLQTLKLGNNSDITGEIPVSIGEVRSLQTLHLDHNGLSGTVPAEIADATSLEELWLANAGLSGVVPPLKRLSALRDLDLSGNAFDNSATALIGDLVQIPGLARLNVAHNPITGAVPGSVAQMLSLVELSFDGTAVTQLPWLALGAMPSLARLSARGAAGLVGEVDWAALSGALVEEPESSSSPLTHVDLAHTGLSGLVDAAPIASRMTQLTTLDLSDCGFTGGVNIGSGPGGLGRLSGLTTLRLDDNDIEALSGFGSLPASIESFGIAGNALVRHLPEGVFDNVASTAEVSLLPNGMPHDCDRGTRQRQVTLAAGPVSFCERYQAEGLKLIYDDLNIASLGGAPGWDTASSTNVWAPCDGVEGTATTWAFVVCGTNADENVGFVTELRLDSVAGTAPWHAIASLSALSVLQIVDSEGVSQTTGGPSHLGNALYTLSPSLTELALSATALGGEFPWASLAGCRGLVRLTLSESNFFGAIDWESVATHTELESIALGRNQWGDAPLHEDLAGLQKLTVFDCPDCGIAGDLGEVDWSQLPLLTELSICCNDALGNDGSCPPWDALKALPVLDVLDIGHCGFDCPLPNGEEVFANMHALTRLYATDARLSGLFSETLAHLPAVTTLLISANDGIEGTVPWQMMADRAAGPTYQVFQASGTGLTGTINGEAVRKWFDLSVLNLDSTFISGSLPDLGGLTSLSSLTLRHTTLSGSLPDMFATLPALYEFTISDTKVSGAVPQSLFHATALGVLDMSTTSLGAIPGRFTATAPLKELRMASNGLTTFPEGFFDGNLALTLEELTHNSMPPGECAAQGHVVDVDPLDAEGHICVRSRSVALARLFDADESVGGGGLRDQPGWQTANETGAWNPCWLGDGGEQLHDLEGVVCNGAGDVMELHLDAFDTVWPSIPWEALGSLTNTRVLRLGSTPNGTMSGAVPVNALLTLTQLEELSLSDLDVEALPPLLLAHSTLRSVSLQRLPDAQGALPQLDIARDLEVLVVSDVPTMEINALPWEQLRELRSLSTLRIVDVSQLTGTVDADALATMMGLTEVVLEGAENLQGIFPFSALAASARDLVKLVIRRTGLRIELGEDFVTALGEVQLRTLVLADNPDMVGAFPFEALSESLEVVDLSNCNFDGVLSLPHGEIGELTVLKVRCRVPRRCVLPCRATLRCAVLRCVAFVLRCADSLLVPLTCAPASCNPTNSSARSLWMC